MSTHPDAHSLENVENLESGFLALLLKYPLTVDKVLRSGLLHPTDFQNAAHTAVFDAIMVLDSSGLPPSIENVASRVRTLLKRAKDVKESEILTVALAQVNSALEKNTVLEADAPIIAMAAAKRIRHLSEQMGTDDETGVETPEWPKPGPAVFAGVGGELVQAIAPHTEADPVAMLILLFAFFGNLVGRNAHFVADGSRHYCNLFTLLVGPSSVGRKGTAASQVNRHFQAIAAEWIANNNVSGLSSGEGLIWRVRDEITKVVDGEEKVVDQGIADKRLTVTETEFASVLKSAQRESNPLSAVIRQAWDGGVLSTLTKNSPTRATDAHISIVGHITKEELLRLLSSSDSRNGFANRFLFVCTKRSKFLPDGGRIQDVDFENLHLRLEDCIAHAESCEELKRDEAARTLWHEVYPSLCEGRGGLFGAVTGRAEAQTMRLALIYALLDQSEVIEKQHLESALALWKYGEESARFIFGSTPGNSLATKILHALRDAKPHGLTLTQISHRLSNKAKSGEVKVALLELQERGEANRVREESTGGRPRETWFASLAHPTRTPSSTDKSAADTGAMEDEADTEIF